MQLLPFLNPNGTLMEFLEAGKDGLHNELRAVKLGVATVKDLVGMDLF